MHQALATASMEVNVRLSAREVHEALPPVSPNYLPTLGEGCHKVTCITRLGSLCQEGTLSQV
jgi:hypothetical protein